MAHGMTRLGLAPALGLRRSLGLGAALNAGGGVLSETAALMARFTGTAPAGRQALIDQCFRILKDAGTLAKLDALHTINFDAQATQRNWIADAYNLSLVDAPAFLADRYYQGDSTNDALAIGLIPSSAGGKFAQDDASFGVVTLATNDAGNKVDIGAQSSGRDTYIGTSNGNALLAINSTGAFPSGYGQPLRRGLITVSRSLAASFDHYVGGIFAGNVANVSTGLPTAQFRYMAGSSLFSPKPWGGGFIGRSLTQTDINALISFFDLWLSGVGAVPKNNIVFDGNSLTFGTKSSDPATKSYPALLAASLQSAGFSVGMTNTGSPSSTTVQQAAKTNTRAAMQFPSERRIAVIWELRNHMFNDGVSATVAVDALQSYCQAIRAQGVDKIVVLNTLRSVTGFTDLMQSSVNAELAARWAGFADAMVDVAADARLSAPTNLTYFDVDGIHLVDAGYAVVNELVLPVVQALAV